MSRSHGFWEPPPSSQTILMLLALGYGITRRLWIDEESPSKLTERSLRGQ